MRTSPSLIATPMPTMWQQIADIGKAVRIFSHLVPTVQRPHRSQMRAHTRKPIPTKRWQTSVVFTKPKRLQLGMRSFNRRLTKSSASYSRCRWNMTELRPSCRWHSKKAQASHSARRNRIARHPSHHLQTSPKSIVYAQDVGLLRHVIKHTDAALLEQSCRQNSIDLETTQARTSSLPSKLQAFAAGNHTPSATRQHIAEQVVGTRRLVGRCCSDA